MVPIWIVTVFAALAAFYTALELPRQEAVNTAIVSSASATNFLAYRRAVQDFLRANPNATGVIDDAALAGFWLPGYIRDPSWSNLVQNNTLYVFSRAAVAHGTVHALYSKSGESMLVGTKHATSGRLAAPNGIDTGIILPAAIASGALVMLGQ